jgi:hypothetical protein
MITFRVINRYTVILVLGREYLDVIFLVPLYYLVPVDFLGQFIPLLFIYDLTQTKTSPSNPFGDAGTHYS